MTLVKETRAATEQEKEVVTWLLTNAAATTAATDLRTQVEGLRVVDGCNCGCPSVDFECDGQGARARIVADAVGQDVNGTLVGAMVWSSSGVISGLEVYAFAEGTTCALPLVDTLKGWDP